VIIGFVIWSAVSLMLLGIGIWTRRSEKPAGFFSGVRPPEVSDVRRYNRAVSVIWFIYTILFEMLGIPLLVLKQNSGGFIWSMLGVVFITIALPVAYNRVLLKYQKH
jgi:hypothetical protein